MTKMVWMLTIYNESELAKGKVATGVVGEVPGAAIGLVSAINGNECANEFVGVKKELTYIC